MGFIEVSPTQPVCHQCMLLCFFANYKRLAAVVQCSGKDVILSAVGELEALAQQLYVLGEIPYRDVGLSQCLHPLYVGL